MARDVIIDHDRLYAVTDRDHRPPLAASRAAIVAVLNEPPRPDGADVRALVGRVDALEVRADLIGDVDPGWLRQQFPGTLIYTLRSAGEGGQYRGDRAQRRARLCAAAHGYDQVDLEWASDLADEVLAAVPPRQRRLFRHVHDPEVSSNLDALIALVDRMTATPAALYVVSIDADAAEDGVPVVLLLAATRRADLTAYATGSPGYWTRILAPWLGAPVVFGRAGTAGDPGLPTLAKLQIDYGFPTLVPLQGLYGIVGRTLARSASPRLHNRAYRELQMPTMYLPFPTNDIERFWRILLPALDAIGLPLRGLTIVSPFKERALDLVDHPSAAAAHCGGANVAWRAGDAWAADTTDTAIVSALIELGVSLHGRRAAVVGCGAAGRSVAAALAAAGAEVFLVNRGHDRGWFAARRLSLPFVPLTDFSPLGFTLVIHATPVTDRVPISLAGLSRETLVLELVYADTPTPLINEASARGLSTVDGWRVLAAEVALQFERMTGSIMPPEVANDRPVPVQPVSPPAIEESR
jgi:3-dehydroquinate dehydratase/shikimate dehydrogenase